MMMPITTSNICHARGAANNGANNRAPKPKLKKKTKPAKVAPTANSRGLAWVCEMDPNSTTVSR